MKEDKSPLIECGQLIANESELAGCQECWKWEWILDDWIASVFSVLLDTILCHATGFSAKAQICEERLT